MKYIYYLLFSLILVPGYGQKNSLEFSLNDPLINKKGRLQVPSSYLKEVSVINGLAQVTLKDTYPDGSNKNRIGFVDSKGKFIIQPEFLQAEHSPHGIIALKTEGKRWVFYKDELGWIGGADFIEEYQIISPEYILVSRDDRWGAYLLSKKNSRLIQPTYKSIQQVTGSTFKFTPFNAWTLRNSTKDSLRTYYFDTLRFINDPSMIGRYQQKFKVIMDAKGSLVDYQVVGPDSLLTGAFNVFKSNPTNKDFPLYKMIEKGKEIKKSKGLTKNILADTLPYDSITGPYEDLFFIYNSGSIAIIDGNGMLLSEFSNKFENVFPFIEGRAKVIKAGKYGFIDQRGNVRVAPQYPAARDFKDGLSAVILNGKWGFIDKDENIVVQPHYQEVKDFKNGIARGKIGAKWFFITKKGEKLTNAYDEIQESRNDKWFPIRNAKVGLANIDGKELLAPRYEQVKDLEDNLVIVKKGGKWGVVDYQENFVYPFEFDYISYDKETKMFLFMKQGKEEILDIKSLK